MFIRVKTNPNSPRKSVQVVENKRDSKGLVKQKILRYMGIALDDNEEAKLRAMGLEWIAKTNQELDEASNQMSLLPNRSEDQILEDLEAIETRKLGRKPRKKIEDILPTNQVTIDDIEEESRVIDGVHEVAGHLYDELQYNTLLPNKRYSNILKDLVLCRISNPSSKHASSKILRRYYMKDHDLDAIYRTMDHVFSKIDDIQKATFTATNSLFSGALEVVLFDVTTLHFESTVKDDLRKFGYSKNFRFNTTQVVLALATNSDGLPIGYELFEGNKAEVKTLIETIANWKSKFAIGNVCFIGDRAMFSEDNLVQLEALGYNYIVAAKLRSLPSVMQDKIMQEDKYIEHTTSENIVKTAAFTYQPEDIRLLEENKANKAKITKYQKSIEQYKNRKFVVSHSAKRARKDAKQRQILLDKIEKQLDQTSNSAKLISNSAIKKFTSNEGKSKSYIDQSKIDLDAKWDGFHGVITNIKETTDGGSTTNEYIINQYKRLVKIEDCFRVNKATLKMRPIYHFKPERIQAHIAVCYMAFSVLRQLEYRIKLQKKLSPALIIEELNSVQSSIFVHKVTKDRYRIPGNFSHEARKIYQAIGVTRDQNAHPIV
jgi:transposase